MESMMAYGGNNILDLTFSKAYQKSPEKFTGSGSAKGFNYSYEVTKAPVAELVTGNSAYNITIRLKNVHIAVAPRYGGNGGIDKNIPLTAQGKVGISNGIFSLTSLSISIDDGDMPENMIAEIINSNIVPKIEEALSSVTLPQLSGIFNSSLTAEIRTGQEITGPAFEIGACITGNTGIGVADAPSSTNISALNSGTASNALVIGMVSDDAINVLIKAFAKPISKTFSETVSEMGFGAGIKATVTATTPVIAITNGTGKAKTRVSIDLKGGIQAPLLDWEWIDVSVPDIDVVINNTLSAEGNKGILTLTSIGSLSIVLNWPSLLSPVEEMVKSLFNDILKQFKGQLNAAIANKKFELFTLPSTIPGNGLSASLSFDTDGLSYSKSSVRALVKIKS